MAAERLRVLTLSTVFPSVGHPGRGGFVRERIRNMAMGASVTVLAPVPFFSRASHRTLAISTVEDDPFRVLAPKWIYPPLIGWMNPVWLFLRLLWPAARLRRVSRYQIIDSHFGFPDGCAATLLAAVFRCPFTVTLRGSEVLHAEYPLRRQAMRFAFQRAARIIAVSERLRKFAIDLGAEPAKVKTIPNGVDTARFFPRDQGESRRKYGLPLDRQIILSAGHLIELKGHHRVVRALAGLHRRGIAVDLVIVGGPGEVRSYEKEIRQTVTELGLEKHVHFLGQVPQQEIAELMAAADLFCLGSSREGWPNVVNESLACGLPVVATDVGAIPQMIPSESYGMIVPAGDAAALENALEKALLRNWDRGAIAEWGKSRSWVQVAREVLEEMRQVVNEGGLA
jgi:teichuronic acid biosynthesis glycosyltransferase TuaC